MIEQFVVAALPGLFAVTAFAVCVTAVVSIALQTDRVGQARLGVRIAVLCLAVVLLLGLGSVVVSGVLPGTDLAGGTPLLLFAAVLSAVAASAPLWTRSRT